MSTVNPVYMKIAEKMKTKNKVVPKLIQKIATLEQAEIMCALPGTIEDIANTLALDKLIVEKHLRLLYERGLVTPGRHGWNLVTNLMLLKDHIGEANPKYDDDEVFDLAQEMSLEDERTLAERIKRGDEIPPVRQVLRVIPKWRSITNIQGVLPIEDIREIFRNNSPIVVHRCPCRVCYRDRLCKDTIPVETCIAAGKTGQRLLERGVGRVLSYDEFLSFLDKLDDEFPLVNTTGNSNLMPSILCSCCPDCCGLFVKSAYTKPLLGQVPYAKSRFIVEENPEACTSCGICIDHKCPVNAISMKYFPEFNEERVYTDTKECIGCGICVLSCPSDARKMRLEHPPEHIPDLASALDV